MAYDRNYLKRAYDTGRDIGTWKGNKVYIYSWADKSDWTRNTEYYCLIYDDTQFNHREGKIVYPLVRNGNLHGLMAENGTIKEFNGTTKYIPYYEAQEKEEREKAQEFAVLAMPPKRKSIEVSPDDFLAKISKEIDEMLKNDLNVDMEF